MLKSFSGANNEAKEQLALQFLYRLKQSQYTDHNSSEFLTDYLRPIALGAAKIVCSQLKDSLDPELPVRDADVEAIALQYTRPEQVLKNFDFNSHASLENYALKVLIILIKKQIIQESDSSRIKDSSDISVLLNLSIQRLRASLAQCGFSVSETINRYCLAWLAFRDLSEEFFPKINSVGFAASSPLNRQQLEQIARRYNQMQTRLDASTPLVADFKAIEEMLSVCASAFRNAS